MNTAKFWLPIISVVISLSACGGGGGGGGGAAPPPASGLPLVKIDSTNAAQAASLAVSAIDVRGKGNVGANDAILPVSVVTSNASNSKLFAFARAQLLKNLEQRAQTAALATGVTSTSTTACEGNVGTFRANFVDADATLKSVSNGDSVTLTFDNCLLDAGGNSKALSGSLAVTFSNIAGGHATRPLALPWTVTTTMTFTNLVGDDPFATQTLTGSFSYTLHTADKVHFDGSITNGNDGFSIIDANKSTGATDTRLLSNLALNFTDDASQNYTILGTGHVSSTKLGGSINFSNDGASEFIGKDATTAGETGFPKVGSMKVVGAANSNATVKAQGDDVNVEIDVDSNGDGLQDDKLAAKWIDL